VCRSALSADQRDATRSAGPRAVPPARPTRLHGSRSGGRPSASHIVVSRWSSLAQRRSQLLGGQIGLRGHSLIVPPQRDSRSVPTTPSTARGRRRAGGAGLRHGRVQPQARRRSERRAPPPRRQRRRVRRNEKGPGAALAIQAETLTPSSAAAATTPAWRPGARVMAKSRHAFPLGTPPSVRAAAADTAGRAPLRHRSSDRSPP
jgi:hypothetical protein